MTLTVFLNVATAIFGAMSAYCWWKSASVQVKHSHAVGDGVWRDASISVDGNDFFATVKAQGLWNKRAAATAIVPAACQAFLAAQTVITPFLELQR
jgi:hypothetical protein